MAVIHKIIKEDRHPLWLVDAIILSAAVYSADPKEELQSMSSGYGLPPSANYQILSDKELKAAGFQNCRQSLLVVRSLSGGHIIVACRGTTDFSDAYVDFHVMHRSLSLGRGAAHAGFLDRAKSIPLDYFRRLLIRGERLVLAGHSLGGAVASLLALRLLESTGKWCHEQVQCYTFGCPLFADQELAVHINSHYKHHFVHIVSEQDIVPKVMPLAYTIYTLWAGLRVGPLQDFICILQLATSVMQWTKRGKPGQERWAIMCTQGSRWVPKILQAILHRGLAFALCRHSGKGYAFAGKMVLLDPSKPLPEDTDEKLKLESYLSFNVRSMSLDVVKGHMLLSYIEHVFSEQSAQAMASVAVLQSPYAFQSANAVASAAVLQSPHVSRAEINMAEMNLEWFDRHTRPVKQLSLKSPKFRRSRSQQKDTNVAFKSKVACLVFARRMQDVAPKKQKKNLLSVVFHNLGEISKVVQSLEGILRLSSALFVGLHLRKMLKKK